MEEFLKHGDETWCPVVRTQCENARQHAVLKRETEGLLAILRLRGWALQDPELVAQAKRVKAALKAR